MNMKIEIVEGSEGNCVCIGNDVGGRRVSGPKPWGGGEVISSYKTTAEEILQSIPKNEIEMFMGVSEKTLVELKEHLDQSFKIDTTITPYKMYKAITKEIEKVIARKQEGAKGNLQSIMNTLEHESKKETN